MTDNIIAPRRRFIQQAGLALVGSCFLPKIAFGSQTAANIVEKKLQLYQVHTGEYFKEVFWAEGRLIPESVKLLNKFLRDWRTNSKTEMAPELFTLLHDIQKKMEAPQPLNIFSAYRCEKTNNALRKKSKGVAKHSRHVTGHAVDFNIPGRNLTRVRDCALSFKAGGVGYYGKTGFVHVDIRDQPAQW